MMTETYKLEQLFSASNVYIGIIKDTVHIYTKIKGGVQIAVKGGGRNKTKYAPSNNLTFPVF